MKLTVFAAAIVSLLFAGTLRAQGPEQAIRGRVVDRGTGEPIASVSIRVTDADGALATGQSNQAGLFSIRLPGAGTWTVAAERIGYEDFTSPPVDVAPGAVLEVQVRMAPATLALDSVGVRVRQTPPFRDVRARQFYDRMERNRGVFLSPERLAEQRGTRTVDLFRHVRSVNVEKIDEHISMRISTNRRCVPTFYIDGRRHRLTERLNDVIDRNRLWAIEVYTSPDDVPAAFPPASAYCGVIVIWTLDA
ncbi:carboxypeptidase-like regulatory domain-containing protein [Longimicrobium sp.]|uniref:carboxypeptidase-like regulatory domain-containing protein n=1 Tax=Longimicrobium sp. TaxID=2029185 RepID=UPI002E35AE7E|nr:carboxypeptidase-like regulatory domain-containing protein [Longimicrobium sp.]HEX6040797.1 carboxypeptidase-like regulatory domain-containing protein [Longimicrobium sp.]